MTGSADPQSSTEGLGARAAKGAAVSVGGQAGKALVQVIGVIVLARLLSPADYGLLALTTVVVGVGDIFRDFGLSTAAVQTPTLSHPQRSNLFWINTIIGCALAGVTWMLAVPIAGVFDQPRLSAVVHGLCFLFVLNGAGTQYRASMERALRFKRLAVIDMTSPAVGLIVAIILASRGAGVWALVAQQLTTASMLMISLVIAGRWIPDWPRRGVPMNGMLRFGWNMVGNQLIGYAANNTDALIIGWKMGPAPLGLYNRAFQLLMQPYNQIRVPVTKVAIPVLSRLDRDEDRYFRFVLKGQVALGYSLCIALSLVAAQSRPLTSLLLGERWMEAGPILSMFAVAAVFQTLASVAYWVYVTKALTNHLFRWSLISAAIKITCVLIGSRHGLMGVALGYAVAPMIAWPLSFWWLSRRVKLPLRSLYFGAARIATVCLTVGGASYVVDGMVSSQPDVVAILLSTVAAVGALLVWLVVPAIRADLRTIADMARLVRR